MALRLLGRVASINVRKVLWTLGEIGVAFEHESDWGDARPASGLAPLNPNATMPVIEDENGILWESNVICRYLATKYARHDLLPAEAGPRSKVEMWMDWQASELAPAFRYVFLATVRKRPGYDDLAQVKESIARWNAKTLLIDAHLAKNGPFMTGAQFTLADIVVGLTVHRWFWMPFEKPEAPHAKTWLERLRARKAGAPYMTTELP